MEKYHVSVAAEAHAAAMFARANYEVSIQYGANQPGYDLVAIKGNRRLLISVKGSQDGGWLLHGRFKKDRTWTEAVEKWKGSQSFDTIMFFVQFKNVSFDTPPRMYLARVEEVANHLLASRAGNISTCLYENYRYSRGLGEGHIDRIPNEWACSEIRLNSV